MTREEKKYIDEWCENWEKHTVAPSGYTQWHFWAEKKSKTHMQVKCAGCGLYKIWVRSRAPSSKKKTKANH